VCRLTTNTDARTKLAAVKALEQMGERGACFDEEVEMLMSDNDPEVAIAAKKAIQTFFDLKAAALENQTKMAIAETPATANHSSPPPPEPSAPSSGSSTAALLFPGQGSQYVKMMSDVKDMPAVKDMLATAQKILGYDLLKLCLEGPEDQLEQTKFCQPAMYIGGLAGLELLRKENPAAAETPRAVAGLSLGEYTALTVAGVFDLETGLRLVKLRGEAMQEAAEASPQKMISLAGLKKEVVEGLCAECRSGDEVCQIANILFPNGFSCAGSKAAMDKLLEKANKTDGCLQAKELKTSGAFHTKCMMPARDKLLAALKEVEPKMKPPTCDVYVNLTGSKMPAGTPVPKIVELLADQLTNCVEWMPCMQAMIQDGIVDFYECGPMKQLKAMMKRIDMTAWKTTQNIHV
ncbi:MCAT, partial [Symbiodinium necroappetens]